MASIIKLIVVFIAAMAFMQSCANSPDEPVIKKEEAESLDTLTLALDWRPNVLHSGIFYAQAKAFYKEEGIYLQWFTPEVDGYTVKPLKKVLHGEADISIGPSEHLFHYAVDSGKVQAHAVATILQEDRSAFVVKAESKINSPKQLSGKTYLGYKTPLENEILKTMIAFDGGEPTFDVKHPGRLEVWENFEKDTGDFAWVFMHWEAALAEHHGTRLRAFKPTDYGIPYGYSSVFMARTDLSEKKQNTVKRFLKATKKGYEAMVQKPTEARKLVCSFVGHDNFSDTAFIVKAQEQINSAYFEENGTWGIMNAEKWEKYLDWMKENNLLEYEKVKDIEPKAFYTNAYLGN